MDFDLNKCVWVQTFPRAGCESWEKEVLSHGVNHFVKKHYDKMKEYAPCRVFIDPFTQQMLFVDPQKESLKGLLSIDGQLTCIEVVKVDSNGPLMVVNRFHILCFRDEVVELLKASKKNEQKARELYLANLIALQQLQGGDNPMETNDMFDHIGPGI